MLIHLVPYSQNILQYTSKCSNLDTVILIPGKYLVKSFSQYKTLTYNESYKKTNLLSISYKQKYILSSIEFSLLLNHIVCDTNNNISISTQTLRRGINEFYYYEIDKNQLYNNDGEKLLSIVIEQIEKYCKDRQSIIQAQALQLFTQYLFQKNPIPKKRKKFAAILPVLYSPSIWKLLIWIQKFHDIELFIHTNLTAIDCEAFDNSEDIKLNNTSYVKTSNISNYNNNDDYFIKLLVFLKKHKIIPNYIKCEEYFIQNKSIITGSFSNTLNKCQYVVQDIIKYKNQNNGGKVAILGNNENTLNILYQELKKEHIEVQNYIPNALVDDEFGSLFWLILIYSLEKNKLVLLAILKHSLCITQENLESVWQFEMSNFRSSYSGSSLKFSKSETISFENIEESAVEKVCNALNNFAINKEDSLLNWCNKHWQCYEHITKDDNKTHKNYLRIASLLNNIFKCISSKYSFFSFKNDIIENNHIVANDINSHEFSNHILSKKSYAGIIEELLHKQEYYEIKENELPFVSIITPIEIRFRCFDYIIFTELNEGVFPLVPIDHKLISSNTRKEHGYDSPALYEVGYCEHDFYSIIYGQHSKVLLLYNDLKEPTRWLQLYIATKNASISQNIENGICFNLDHDHIKKSNIDYSEPIISDYNKATFITKHLKYSCSPQIPTAIRPKRISATAIAKLIQNPYSYYLEYVLSLRKIRDIDEIPNMYIHFGIMLHEILAKTNELLFAKNKSGNEKECYFKAVENLFQQISNTYIRNKYYLKKIWKERVLNIVEWLWCNKNDVITSYAECKGEMICSVTKDHKVIIEAKIDRVDVLQLEQVIKEKKLLNTCDQKINSNSSDTILSVNYGNEGKQDFISHIVDYKTGALPSKQDIENGISPQLALEGLILKMGKLPCLYEFSSLSQNQISLIYVQLNGRKNLYKEIDIDLNNSYHNLMRLLNTFYKEEESYVATHFYREKLYGHLARYE